MTSALKQQAATLTDRAVFTKQLGKHGPQVTALGFGCMGLSIPGPSGKPKPDEERYALLDHIYKSGAHFWDSADIYADNEDLLGKYDQPQSTDSSET